MMTALDTALKRTPLHDLHHAQGAVMAPFAGYDMPIQYPKQDPGGVMAEHQWTREKVGLFDVSHMGQAVLLGRDAEAVLESLAPIDAGGLAPGRQRYTLLLTDEGGIQDDLMVSRPTTAAGQSEGLFLVVNASEKDGDFARIAAACAGKNAALERLEDRALLAVQGPGAGLLIARHAPATAALTFMDARADVQLFGVACTLSRSGYTGEDGFEISIPADKAAEVTEALLDEPETALIGLGARDSLRLEAGLCLYGHDIDTTTSPIEAGLTWAVSKARREAGGFPGHARIMDELARGTARQRIGFRMMGRLPAREGDAILANGQEIGRVTSGTFGPTVGLGVGMAYVSTQGLQAAGGESATVQIDVRGKGREAVFAPMPFAPHRYKRS